ncbi:PQQ-binding-like beta-propeller repeat protein [bacterium]|nr:PQQ-binding-like beta-propeller repeat protein [bacterium]
MLHRLIPCILLVMLLSACGGGGTAPDPAVPDPVTPLEPQLADPSEVQNPLAIEAGAAVLWQGQGGDAANTGRSSLQLPAGQPRISTVTSVSDRTSSSAAVAPDGSVLVGCGQSLLSFAPDGALRWQRSLLRQLNSRPLVDDNGQIVIPGGDPAWLDSAERGNWIEAIDSSGQTRWRFMTGDYPALLYARIGNGNLLVRSASGEFSLLSPGGSLLWQRDLGVSALYNALSDDSGNIYCGSDQQALFSLDSAGQPRWDYSPPQPATGSLTTNTRLLHPDGSILLLSGREGEDASFLISRLSTEGELLGSWPCGEQFSFAGTDDSGALLLYDRESSISRYSLTGELLDRQVPGYGFPFGINTSLPQRYFSVLAQPDDFSEYLLTSTDPAGSELWRLSSQWSFRYPVLDDRGMLFSGDERSFFALDSLGRRHWQRIHGGTLSGLSVSESGRIYSCGGRNLYAFAGDGQQLWQVSADGEAWAAPALLPSGQLAFGDSEGFFYFYENNGTRHSKFILDGQVLSSPAVGPDGTIYVGTTDGELYSFGADLSPQRQFHADSGIRLSPAIDASGTVYVATEDGHIHAVYSDGIEAWERNLAEPLASALVHDGDYRVFGSTTSGRVFALHAYDGSLLWDLYLGTDLGPGLALDSQGRLLAGSDSSGGRRESPQLERNGSGRGLYCITPDGELAWSLNGPYSFSSQVLVDGSGRICTEAGGWLVCLDADGKELWRLQAGFEDALGTPVPLSDGRFAVCSGTQLLIVE